jgi:hypothetical protein
LSKTSRRKPDPNKPKHVPVQAKVQIGNQKLLYGWAEISKYFPYAQSTVLRKYAKEMLDAGFVFKSLVEDSDGQRRWRVWAFESLVISYISQKQAMQGYI